ncbi:MAG: hypothetical protein EON93_03250 [Burkholderiales bacterium]|nr:MAG: hypothetical protein EON93_03250 [Burkholderiales bacterium]
MLLPTDAEYRPHNVTSETQARPLENSRSLKARVACSDQNGHCRLIFDHTAKPFSRQLAAVEISISAMEVTEHRVMAALVSGGNPGPMSSMLKTQGTETMQRVEELAVQLAGAHAAVEQPDARILGSNIPFLGPDEHVEAMARYLNGRAASIYGGSNEVQRGVMARLLLGL